jgi:glycosyltransferase involved in cell wall biosynthesis
LEKAISFEPFRQDVPDVLAAADIFVLPSLWEGLPIGLLEAMSMGKAIVATDVDGTREVISHGETGLLVSPGQDAGLREALERVIDDAALRRKLQANASVVAKEKFNAGSMTRQIENIYKKALHGIRTDR